MRITLAQLPEHEDSTIAVFTASNAVIVVDPISHEQDDPVPAAHYAARLGEHIRDELDLQSSIELHTALANSIAGTARDLHLTPDDSPISSVSIVRASGVNIDMLLLGDTPVVLPSGVVRGHSANALETGAGEGITNGQEVRGRFSAHSAGMAGADPGIAGKALTASRSSGWDRWAIVAGDGTFSAIKAAGLDDWNKIAQYDHDQLRDVLRECRCWEVESGPRVRSVTGLQEHDDKAIALARWDV